MHDSPRWALRAAAALAALGALLIPSLAHAQGSSVYQNGTAVANHLAKFVTNGRIADAGALLGDANGIGVNPFAVTDNGGLAVCANDKTTLGPYTSLCFGHDASGAGVIKWDGGPGAAPFNIVVNGSTYVWGNLVACTLCGTMSAQNSDAINVTGGTVSGLTHLETLHGTVGNLNTLFTNNGAHLVKLSDRVFVGAEAVKNSSDTPRTTSTWLSSDPNLSYLDTFSTLQVINPIAGPAVTGAGRTSACGTNTVCSGGAGQTGATAIGLVGIAFNDDTRVVPAGTGPNAFAGYFEAHRNNGVGGSTQAVEIDIVNFGDIKDLDPNWQSHFASVAGFSIGQAINAGGANAGSGPPSVAMAITGNGSTFRKGIMFSASSISGNFDVGLAVAIESPLNYTWRWLDTGGVAKTQAWGEVDGWHMRGLYASLESGGGISKLAGNLGGGVFPPTSITSWAITSNFASQKEVNFWSLDETATTSFLWQQKTGASAANQLAKLGPNGDLIVKGNFTAQTMPTTPISSPGAYVCIDAAGAFYKKASCP